MREYRASEAYSREGEHLSKGSKRLRGEPSGSRWSSLSFGFRGYGLELLEDVALSNRGSRWSSLSFGFRVSGFGFRGYGLELLEDVALSNRGTRWIDMRMRRYLFRSDDIRFAASRCGGRRGGRRERWVKDRGG